MSNKDFTTTILVDQTPKEAFDAINNVRGWWFGDIEGRTEKLNDEFTYQFKEFHYSKQRLVEFIPDKKVVWLVTDSSLNFVEDRDEWTGTKISFEVTPKGDKTEVRFMHEGLVPSQECYDACSNAWGDYIQKSLRSLIRTGKGEAIF